MLRSILGVVAGLISAFVVISVVEMLGHVIYPPPAGIDFSDPESIRKVMGDLPFGSLVFVLMAWLIGTLVGTLIAGSIARKKERLFGSIVGGLLLVSGIANMVMIPHPVWFMIIGILVFPIAAYLGSGMAISRNTKNIAT